MKIGINILALFIIITFTQCKKQKNFFEASAVLNDQLKLPPGSFQVNDDQLTTTDDIQLNSSSNSGTAPLKAGQNYNLKINYSSDNGGVSHAAIRFGDNGKTWMVPINGASNQKSGVLNLPFGIPPEICNDLSSICHDIKCYEFAARETSAGSFQISRENINNVAMLCGNCDEPSCQGLLENCDDEFQYNSCEEAINASDRITEQYLASLSNGDIDSYCVFMTQIIGLYKSEGYIQCVTQGGGYTRAEWLSDIQGLEESMEYLCK